MIDFKKELEKFKPCMNTDEVEEAIYGSDLKDLTDIMREVIEEFRENEKELAGKIKAEIKEELEEERTEIATNTFLISGKPVETSKEEKAEPSSEKSMEEQAEKVEDNSQEKTKQPTDIENTNKSEEDKGGTK